MKILNICMGAPFTEGYSYQDNLLSEYQHKLGHEVTVLTTTRTRNSEGKIIEISEGKKILDNGVRLIRVKAGSKFKQFFGYYPEIKTHIINSQPDMIFVHGLGTLVVSQAINYKKNYQTTYIVADNHQDEGTTYTRRFPFSIQLSFFKIMWKSWIKYVEKVYGTTSWRVRFAQDFYGIPKNKIDILVMGVDSDTHPADIDQVCKAIRTELNITKDTFVFITGGKLDKRKSTIEAMQAFHKIDKEDIKFIIFGSVADDIKDEFNLLLEKDKRFIYLGYLESKIVHRYFYAADFGVFPGRHSVLWEEAIGCGLPCMFKKYEENDHTNVYDNSIIVENPDSKKIYECMEKVMKDRDYYLELKNNAECASKYFSYHEVAKKSISVVQ